MSLAQNSKQGLILEAQLLDGAIVLANWSAGVVAEGDVDAFVDGLRVVMLVFDADEQASRRFVTLVPEVER